eukprot:2210617-Rhodomonas_salina.2
MARSASCWCDVGVSNLQGGVVRVESSSARLQTPQGPLAFAGPQGIDESDDAGSEMGKIRRERNGKSDAARLHPGKAQLSRFTHGLADAPTRTSRRGPEVT